MQAELNTSSFTTECLSYGIAKTWLEHPQNELYFTSTLYNFKARKGKESVNYVLNIVGLGINLS